MINNTHIIPPKGLKEIKEHFKERLLERYAIDISDHEYEIICSKEYVFKNFLGVYKKNGSKTVGYLKINGLEVICLYQRDNENELVSGKFVTCYPKNADKTDEEIMRVCFGSREIFRFAMICYKRFEYELRQFKKDNIPTIQEAGRYLFVESEYCFPQALIELYKHGEYNKWHLCRRIRDIIFDNHPCVELFLKKTGYKEAQAKTNTNGSDVEQ